MTHIDAFIEVSLFLPLFRSWLRRGQQSLITQTDTKLRAPALPAIAGAENRFGACSQLQCLFAAAGIENSDRNCNQFDKVSSKSFVFI